MAAVAPPQVPAAAPAPAAAAAPPAPAPAAAATAAPVADRILWVVTFDYFISRFLGFGFGDLVLA